MNKHLLDLTYQGMRKKKREYLLLFTVLTLSFTFIILVLSITNSMYKSNQEFMNNTYGVWNAAILDGKTADLRFLKQEMGIDTVGCSQRYGLVAGKKGIGTIDDSFKKLGRIQLLEGKLPQNPGEVAVEADLLNELGYDYQIGQKISLPIIFSIDEDNELLSTEQYILTGVLKRYTDIWVTGEESLNAVVITENDGKKMEKEYGILPSSQYFFETINLENAKVRVIESYLRNSLGNPLCRNIKSSSEKKQIHIFYMAMVLCTTWLAVVCVYLVQIKDNIRHITLFRCIGITKRQLVMILFYETCLLIVPAVIVGSAAGILGTGMVLLLYAKVSVENIRLSICWSYFTVAVLLWTAGIFYVRLLVFRVALRQPLTGTIQINKKWLYIKRGKMVLLIILGGFMNAVLLFSVVHGKSAWNGKINAENKKSYMIQGISYRDGGLTEEKEEILSIPGISRVKLYGRTSAALSFDGMDYSSLVTELKNCPMHTLGGYVTGVGEEHTIAFPQGIGVSITIIPDEEFVSYFEKPGKKINQKDFCSGNQVIVAFPTDSKGNVNVYKEDTVEQISFEQTGIREGDMINLDFYGFPEGVDIWDEEPEKVGHFMFQVGEIYPVVSQTVEGNGVLGSISPYEICCSESLFKKMLTKMKPGYVIKNYLTGTLFDFTNADIYTTSNAQYLSTDYVITNRCMEKGLRLENQRELVLAHINENIQILLFVGLSGICVILILGLILWDILSLAAKDKNRSCDILRVLGMSFRQIKRKLMGEAVVMGLLSVMLSWMIYGVYILVQCIERQKYLMDEYEIHKNIGIVLAEWMEYQRFFGLSEKQLAVTVMVGTISTIVLYYYPVKHRIVKM